MKAEKSGRSSAIVTQARARWRTPGEARLALLSERGVSLREIGRAVGKTISLVSRVNHGLRRSAAIEQEIADRLGLSVPDAFPERRPQRKE